MDGMRSASLDSIVAPLNFLAPMAERPVAYNYEPLAEDRTSAHRP